MSHNAHHHHPNGSCSFLLLARFIRLRNVLIPWSLHGVRMGRNIPYCYDQDTGILISQRTDVTVSSSKTDLKTLETQVEARIASPL